MYFFQTLVEDGPEILAPISCAGSLGEPVVFSSCLNPLSISLSVSEETQMDADEIMSTLCDFLEENAEDSSYRCISHNFDVSEDMILYWINSIMGTSVGITYKKEDMYEMLHRKNIEAINELYFHNVKAIQITVTPADEKGHTLSLSGDFRANSELLINMLKDQFGDFTMVCFPLDLGIGGANRPINQFICHIYNDRNSSMARGMIMTGNICSKCGDFYTMFPEQIEFCCEL